MLPIREGPPCRVKKQTSVPTHCRARSERMHKTEGSAYALLCAARVCRQGATGSEHGLPYTARRRRNPRPSSFAGMILRGREICFSVRADHACSLAPAASNQPGVALATP
eukprot:5365021-Pleurochrysis_carterae.AAC.3